MTTTSIRSEDNSNMAQESIGSTSISMSKEDNETWYNTNNEEYDLWHDAIKTMDNYQEWVDPPTTDKTGCTTGHNAGTGTEISGIEDGAETVDKIG